MVIRSSGLLMQFLKLKFSELANQHERRGKILVDQFISNLLLPYILGVPVQSRY